MKFEKLDYLMAVAEEQNLTKAAARLYISQPALTSALNKLENELGTKLLERKRPPIRLTPAGTLYVNEMNRIRQLQLNLQNHLSTLSKPQLRIKLGAGRGHYWLPILLPAFHSLHPEVHITIIGGAFNSLVQSFDREETDFALGTMNLLNTEAPINGITPNLVSEDLIQEQLVYVIPKSLGLIHEDEYHGCSIKKPLVINSMRLDGQPFVCPDYSSTYSYYLEREMNLHHFHYGELIVYGTPQASMLLASSGMGITFTSNAICRWERIQKRYDVSFCSLSTEPPTQTIRAFYKNNNPQISLIQDIVRLIRELVIPKLYSSTI